MAVARGGAVALAFVRVAMVAAEAVTVVVAAAVGAVVGAVVHA